MQKRNNNEIGFEELKTFMAQHKWLLIISVLVSTVIAMIIAYTSPNIYQATSSIEIVSGSEDSRDDLMGKIMHITDENMINEKEIIQSRYMIFKALEKLNIGTRYFVKTHFKMEELYKNSPFIVESGLMTKQIEGYTFQLIPIDEKNFRLTVEPSLKTKILSKIRSYIAPLPKKEQPIHYDYIHEFAEPIHTPWFHITVQKIYKFENKPYFFTITPNKKMFEYIQKRLTVSKLLEKGTILSLSFEDTVPLRAKEILDSIGYAYVNEKLNLKIKSAQKKLNFIDSQLKAIKKILKTSANKLQAFKSSNIIVNIEEKTSVTTQKLSELEAQRYKLEMRKSVLENIHHYIETHHDIRGIDVSFKDEQYSNSTVDSIIIKIQNANARRIALLLKHTEQHPSVKNIDKELASLRQALKESIESSLRSTDRRLTTLNGIIKEQKDKLRSLPEQEIELASLTRDFMVNEKIYSYLLEKRAETAIAESSAVSNTRMINTALVPETPIKPKRILIIISGFILGIIIGIILAATKSFLNNTIKTTSDVEQLTTIPIYGTLPLFDAKKNKQIYNEFIRVLWANLAFARGKGKSKLITLTSTVGGEGKTSTVCELGKAIASSGKKVIILDLDMRKPTLHKKCKLFNNEGMSSLLAENILLDSVIQKTKYANLSVIASGRIPPNPTELIMSDTLKPVIDTLLMKYDYVLLDSPPVGLVADAIMLMHMSDISLFLLKANYSKKEFIRNINRITNDPDINPGIILNSIDFTKGSGYGYGHISKYSSGYYGSKQK
jgi:capsular exopolysaccharide synthesis family protein